MIIKVAITFTTTIIITVATSYTVTTIADTYIRIFNFCVHKYFKI